MERFEIKNVPFGNHIWRFCLLVCEEKYFSITCAETKPLTIILTEEAIQGEQIVVSASKHEQKVQDLPVSTTVISGDNISRKII